ncbi:hypothetical protein [Geotalea uraniireducens]|uniref:Uncharacterized protein n=1 Tax=Geotalea uraniireducens (strain Rf4) TaxID=351605 RepID=A5GCT6_GEOUR|nr:hypothetical protein [Geotalea uraniireducens]ABQ24606.1 hypothetical protein Gura_0390 [Geotalea uraniireducens Rf4]
MTDEKLMKSLSKLGFPMFEPSEELNVNETLAEVVKSQDTRLWEGFPVLLANAADSYQFAPELVEQLLPGREDKDHFHRLLLLSSSLYSFYHLTFTWSSKLKKNLSSEDKSLVKKWRNCLAHNQALAWDDVKLDPERLKGLFELYFEQNVDKTRRRKEKYEEFSLAYALSQVFSPKQKELFKKKLEGLPLTKTEQEYYSRSVKKKVVALANSELHSLARKLLEQ